MRRTICQFTLVGLLTALIFWGCEKQQPIYYPPPLPPPVPSVLPKAAPATFQSGAVKVDFEDKDLKTCELLGGGVDGQLNVDFEGANQTYLTFRLRRFNAGSSEHKTLDPSYGWIYLRIPPGAEFNDNDSEYVVFYQLEAGREKESSFCVSSYSISGTTLSLAFDCQRLYNGSRKTRNFRGSAVCNLRTLPH